MGELVYLFLKPDNSFKLYFADVRGAIEVPKNYLGDDKKGVSHGCIIIYHKNNNHDDNNDNNNNNNNNDNSN